MANQQERQAVLVVSFGTSYRDTLERTIGAIERRIGEAFPEYQVRRAFTSGMIRRKLQRRDGVTIDSVEEALERLWREGCRRVICQPTHMVNGTEYNAMAAQALGWRDRFDSLAVGQPLLTTDEDFQTLVESLGQLYSRPGSPEEAVVLMGHGSEHYANAAYAALDYRLKDSGLRNFFVGTVESYPTLETVLRQVADYGPRRVTLAPLMVVAGDHATNDMAGEEDSWQASLEQAGYPVEVVLRGLGEYPCIQDQFVEHVRRAIAQREI